MALDLQKLIDYFEGELGLDDVGPETPLFSSGQLDSFTLVDVLLWLENEGGIQVPPSEVTFENLDTPERILLYSLTKGVSADGSLELVEESNAIVDAYSAVAEAYDGAANAESFWDGITREATRTIDLERGYGTVADIGCGTGNALADLAARAPEGTSFVGVEPAEQMRARAAERLAGNPAVVLYEGTFEDLPLSNSSIDYLYSTWAFHWASDADRAAAELARVLSRRGEMDLWFTGRHSGREFAPVVSPVYAEYLGLDGLLASVKRRQALDAAATRELLERHFPSSRLDVQDVYRTFYDTVEGHWGWWVRIEGHFSGIEESDRDACDRDVRAALETLATPKGVPYTMHMVHARLRGPGGSA